MYTEKVRLKPLTIEWNEDNWNDYDSVYTIEEFEDCRNLLNDYGFGHPVKDLYADETIRIEIDSEKFNPIPDDATHIVWYNNGISN